MTTKSFYRGWSIYWDNEIKKWRYEDDNSIHRVKNPRPCKRCGSRHSSDSPDPCLGLMPEFRGACCGHGAEDGYALYSTDYRNNHLNIRLKKRWYLEEEETESNYDWIH